MFKTLLLCFGLAAICAVPGFSAEGHAAGGSRFSSGGHSFTEGTVSSVGANGHFTVHGAASPYASNYHAYNSGYYSTPEAERGRYSDGWRNRFGYNWSDTGLTDYSYDIPDYNTFSVYDDPNYGNDFSTWTYTDPPVYHYGDLRVGDRVVVGVDGGHHVHSVFRVHPGGHAHR